MSFEPADPDFVRRVRDSFARQTVMATLGARLERVDPGEVRIALDYREDLTQQHGYLHAGIVGTILDSACGYAAFTLMPADAAVLSVEYKINLLAPARGSRFVAHGQVRRAGRNLTVCTGTTYAHDDDGDPGRPIAEMLATMMTLRDRDGLHG